MDDMAISRRETLDGLFTEIELVGAQLDLTRHRLWELLDIARTVNSEETDSEQLKKASEAMKAVKQKPLDAKVEKQDGN